MEALELDNLLEVAEATAIAAEVRRESAHTRAMTIGSRRRKLVVSFVVYARISVSRNA
jgi:hypothetical protein